MSTEIPKQYNPKDFEDKWFDYWENNKLFRSKVDKNKTPYTIVIPPPNVTSRLHMGHGLNNTLQDILIRWKRMCGYNACWVPGTDHAGIATQHVVEKKLAKQGKKRQDIGREEFLKEVWAWKEEHGNIIIEQLKKLGCSCDWDRERFTLDKQLSKAVRHMFVKLFDDGLIYKGNRIINWCPHDETALSDDEIFAIDPKKSDTFSGLSGNEYRDFGGMMYHIKYPLSDGSKMLEIATTRPETMLGDTAVAVNPKDERYKDLIGKKVKLPLTDRVIPIVADDYVDMEFGTGIVKITPAHDANDFEVGQRHNLPVINIMDKNANITEPAPKKYVGMNRFECRKQIIMDLESQGLFIKKHEHEHVIGTCYRCGTIIEPWLSKQWFVKMKPLAEPAIKVAEENQINFYPENWKKVYLHWLNNVRDWCISRQLWWGHRIPIWYCNDCNEIIASEDDITECTKCGSKNLKQDEDVLDTWFSSWLWPISTLGWPDNEEDLEYYYPTDVLSTAPEIIFLWVARMVMSGLYARNKIPFKDVYLHVTICDAQGRKMSKSLGNGIDPLDAIDEYGADALRFTVVSQAPLGDRMRLSMEDFKTGSRFANKIWNVSRFLLMNLNIEYFDTKLDINKYSMPSKWILHTLNESIQNITNNLNKFRFAEAASQVYEFIWHNFCDWYVEIVKKMLYSDKLEYKHEATTMLVHILDSSLRLLHPFMPFITEEIWQQLPVVGNSIAIAEYPKYNELYNDSKSYENMQLLQDIVHNIRNIRGEMKVAPDKKVEVIVKINDSTKNIDVNFENNKIVEEYKDIIVSLAKLSKIEINPNAVKPAQCAVCVNSNFELYVSMTDVIDVKKENERLTKEKIRLEKELEKVENKLKSESFVSKAPQEIVDREKQKLKTIEDNLSKIIENLRKIP